MVAPSFQDFKVISAQPFLKGNKYYITVEHPNTLRQRDVRWYSEKEYARLYGKKLNSQELDGGFDGLKQARGFGKGSIFVIRGNKSEDEEWLRHSPARYSTDLGWHFVSTDILPKDAPLHFKYIQLSWDEFKKNDDRHMKTTEELTRLLNDKLRTGQFFSFEGIKKQAS